MIDLNDVATTNPRHDLAAVRDRLTITANDWLPRLFPEAQLARDRRALRCADLSGRAPRKDGSCTIHLEGPYAGWGFDYATGERAGPIDLIAQATGLSDAALFDEAARIAGMDHPAPRSAPRPKPDHSAEIARLVAGAIPLAGTVGEDYLRARGLPAPASPDLLFHPDLPDFETKRGWPGLIALARIANGDRAPGIHRTFLLDDGNAKAPAGKKMLGSVADAAVRLFAMPEDGHLGVAEGVETAVAAHDLFGTPVWAALSADGLARFRWPEGTTRITIYADAGDAGRQAAATLSDRLNLADIPNEIVLPLHGDDFNDDLMRGARAQDYRAERDVPETNEATGVEILPVGDDEIAALATAAEALTNPPDISSLGQLLGRLALARLDPLPARQILAGIKAATGIPMAILEKQLAELGRRVNATGDPNARIAKLAWFNRLRQDMAGTVERLMRTLGIKGVVRGKKGVTTNPDTSQPCPDDTVNRLFKADRPNQLWVSDFTYVPTWSGTVYVAFVIDVFARRIVGWRVSTSMATQFVLDALDQAIWQRKTSDNNALVHHSDRGSQYLSIKHTERLVEVGIDPSVGTVGDSYDNALAECVIGLFKTEVLYRD